jgi:long-chain acyl-CoA synthetase
MTDKAAPEVVLVTGATGFLGTEVLARLLERTGGSLVVLVRARDARAARHRAARAWWERPELLGAIGGRIRLVAGDVAEPRLGLGDDDWRALATSVTHIVHLAADLRLDAAPADAARINVGGVASVIELARAARDHHGLARLAHVSTAYVAGLRRGEIREDDLCGDEGFANLYEQTKYEGECLVRAARSELPVTVMRPGMIVGDSRTGAARTFNTVYTPLRLYLTGHLGVLPARSSLRVNMIPVDWVADAIVRLTFDPAAEGATVHLTAPYETLPRAGELLEATRTWAAGALGVRLPRPLVVPLPRRPLGRAGGGGLGPTLPYLAERHRFRRDTADRLLGPATPTWRDYLPNLLADATARGFMHRTGRTVHEQLLARLDDAHRPVRYTDLVEGIELERDTAELRLEMLAAAGALRRLGIGPGDRVVVIGPNSTRYLTAQVAIGLAGAVSVPVHPLSPPAEIDRIMADCDARLVMAGTPAVLDDLDRRRPDMPLVSFCAGMAGTGHCSLDWQGFLALGAGHPGPAVAPVEPGDLAAIHYTSGTTGTAKGAAFTHGQLTWMAATVAGLLPWTARTSPAVYLSFLPMSHVVEGILGTWAPYWLPAPLRITFLDDIRAAGRALPQVRPTIFFSVPRLYEKAWAALAATPLGHRYLHEAGRLERACERPVLRRVLLRRAGLDRCGMLIAGSAPIDAGLLRNLDELGVEVCNAYGLTEAPLIALNRHGRNLIPTVGEPLPATTIRIADDGEILVRGPQVTAGYVSQGAVRPLGDDWLATGDLGHLGPGGTLQIDGRKKELLRTAYGHYLDPARTEAMLRGLPGVTEALVVGEGRPYCAALLWAGDGPDEDAIAGGIRALNAQLARPEQVRRWTALPDDLSIEHGDLTTSLKLRRAAVTSRFHDEIEDLYQPERAEAGR